jgi:hypothetical protein
MPEFSQSDRVETPDGPALVLETKTESFEMPVDVDDEGETVTESVDASSSNPVYIVGLMEGGNAAFDEDQLTSYDGTFSDKEETDPQNLAGKAEMAEVYQYTDKPYDMEELQLAKERLLCSTHGVDNVEELINIPGVDDPGVGFDSLPDGWNRASVLDAWTSLGASFTTCRADMVGEIRSPTRFCAALKDEVYGTELWRNRF